MPDFSKINEQVASSSEPQLEPKYSPASLQGQNARSASCLGFHEQSDHISDAESRDQCINWEIFIDFNYRCTVSKIP